MVEARLRDQRKNKTKPFFMSPLEFPAPGRRQTLRLV